MRIVITISLASLILFVGLSSSNKATIVAASQNGSISQSKSFGELSQIGPTSLSGLVRFRTYSSHDYANHGLGAGLAKNLALSRTGPAINTGIRGPVARGVRPKLRPMSVYPYDDVVIDSAPSFRYQPVGPPASYTFTFSFDNVLVGCAALMSNPCTINLYINGFLVTSEDYVPTRNSIQRSGRSTLRSTIAPVGPLPTHRLGRLAPTTSPCSQMGSPSNRGSCSYTPPSPCGMNVQQVTMVFNGVTYVSQPVQLNNYDSRNCHKRVPKCQCFNGPIDPVTGGMSWEHTDLNLSGPFGLFFGRSYNSQSNSTGALGPNWHFSYADYLDLTNYSMQNSEFKEVVYYNDEGAPDYFELAGPTRSSPNTYYEDASGDRITVINPGVSQTYKVTTFHGMAYTFSNTGILQSESDRHGNTQTLAYTAGKLTSVTDVLGRTLTFTYDTIHTNLLHNVISYTSANNPNGAAITFGYTTNGTVTNLTSVTEPDGQAQGKSWLYGYDSNGLLNAITDPSGTYRESDVYGLIPNQTTNYQVLSQTSSNPLATGTKQNTLAFSYLQFSCGCPLTQSTTVTDGDQDVSTFTADASTFRVNSATGPLCNCQGAVGMVYENDQFGRLDKSYSTGGNPGLIYYTHGEDSCLLDGQGGCAAIVYPEPVVTQIVRQSSVGCIQTACPTMPPTTIGYGPLDSSTQDLPTSISYPSVAVTVPGASPNPGQSPTTETLTYDTGDKAELLTDSVSGLTSNSSGSLVVQTNTVTYTYNSFGRIHTIVGPNAGQSVTFVQWPDNATDRATRGQTKTITYAVTPLQNGNGSLQWTFAPAGLAAPFNNYDVYGNPGGVQDPSGGLSGATYSLVGQTTSVAILATINGTVNPTTSYSHDFADRLTRITKPLGNYSSLAYDATGRLTAVTRLNASNLNEEQLAFTYSTMSRLATEQASYCGSSCASVPSWITAQKESYRYDGLESLNAIVHPIPSSSPSSFGLVIGAPYPGPGFGELDSTMDELHPTPIPNVGPFQAFAYDGYQRLQTANGIFGMRDTVTNVYNTSDEQTSIGTGSGSVGDNFAYAYDDFGRVIAWSSTDVGGTYRYTYDSVGNRIGMTDPLLNSTTYSYDTVNRLLSQVSVGPAGTDSVSFSYDNSTGCTYCIGRLTKMTDPTGSTAYTYEIRGLLLSEARTISSTVYTTSFTYDANGNQISITYPSSRKVNYSYDFADRPISASTTSTTYVSAASYEPFGPIGSITYGNNTERILTYDLRYQPQDNRLVPTGNPNAPIVDFGYQEDLDGNDSAISDNLHPPVPPATLGSYDRAFKYDNANDNRLIEADGGPSLWGVPAPGSCLGKYCYGPDGVIASYQLGAQPAITFTYGLTAQTTSYKDGTNPAVSITYDADGNEASVGAAIYSYSSRNLLASGDGLTYGYDGFGLRTTTSKSGVGSRYSFYSANAHLLEETNVTTGTPSAAYDYVWFAEIPVAQEDISSGQTHWTMSDYIGTPIAQTSSTGSLYWQADYTPSGEIFNNTLRVGVAIHQPLRFPGQEAEQFSTVNTPNGDTGRAYNIRRWYRPHFQRYSQLDQSGAIAGTNPYEYAWNATTIHFDPLGMWSVSIQGMLGDIPITAGSTIGWGDQGPFIGWNGGLGAGAGASFNWNDNGPKPEFQKCGFENVDGLGLIVKVTGIAGPLSLDLVSLSGGGINQYNPFSGQVGSEAPYSENIGIPKLRGFLDNLGFSLSPGDYLSLSKKAGYQVQGEAGIQDTIFLFGLWDRFTGKKTSDCSCPS